MKLRVGFVTNSSSTNFIILSKEEITVDYLYKKLGFKKKSVLQKEAEHLCREIMDGIEQGPKHMDDNVDYEEVMSEFGKATADKYQQLKDKGYHVYVGRTSSEEGGITSFFTTDSFVIDEKGFYVNGRSCVW